MFNLFKPGKLYFRTQFYSRVYEVIECWISYRKYDFDQFLLKSLSEFINHCKESGSESRSLSHFAQQLAVDKKAPKMRRESLLVI